MDSAGGDGEFLIIRIPNPQISEGAWALVHRALAEYGFIPDPERHDLEVEARYPEFNSRHVQPRQG